jgi:methionyl-tRNA formyltransferase
MNRAASYAFFGTGLFAARCLELLSEWRAPSWVVTSPARASGRGRVSRSPVGEFAAGLREALGTPLVESAAAASDDAVLELTRRLPVDFSFVVDFGQLIREPLLGEGARVGCLNIHPSALPLYRGAAPIQRALMDGAESIGVTVFKLARRMDAGPVLLMETVRVEPDDDFGSLRSKAAEAGVRAFVDFASERPISSWRFEPQDDALATDAPKISAPEERVNWERPAREVVRQVRALSPRPGAWTTLRGKRLLILSAREVGVERGKTYQPGELRLIGDLPSVAAGDGAVALTSVQPEGKRPLPAAAWRNGLRLTQGERLI